jgi:N-acetylglucosamine kinase-like BadF-type ATPase
MRYVLGVDAGASKTLAVVAAEEGHVLGVGRGGPANHQVVGLEAALEELGRACQAALTEAGISPPVDLAMFGLAGADLPEDFELLVPAVRGLGLARQALVENDTMVALRAGASRDWGVVVVCGAGFNAAGRAPDGRAFRLPGLGWLSGDWGGGGDIAREAVRLVCRAWDGRGRPTALTDLVLRALGFSSVEELIAGLYRAELGRSARFGHRLLDLVPLVFQAAQGGDEPAQELLIRVGEEVGQAATAVMAKLGLEKTDVEVILAGSVFKGEGPLLLDTVTQAVHWKAPRARVRVLGVEPVAGAVLLALEALEVNIDGEICGTLLATLPPELRLREDSPNRGTL